MPRYDFVSQRLYMKADLSAGRTLELERGQANYLLNVLRLKSGGQILVFNGEQGEWRGTLLETGRKKATIELIEQVRPQPAPYNLGYAFAPIKAARLEYMVQKAVEMGAGRLQPVITEYTQLRKLNMEKLHNYAIEAAEQCGILSIPSIREPLLLPQYLDQLEDDRHVVFCDEEAAGQNPIDALRSLNGKTLDLLVGPEGGFSPQERQVLRQNGKVCAIPLGPRVLRADTAAVAALAVVQAVVGDWRDQDG